MISEVNVLKDSPSFSYLSVIMSVLEFSLQAAIVIQDFLVLIIKIIFILLKETLRKVLPKWKKDLSRETVLITGSAQGLGRQLALDAANLGAKIVLWDINEVRNIYFSNIYLFDIPKKKLKEKKKCELWN